MVPTPADPKLICCRSKKSARPLRHLMCSCASDHLIVVNAIINLSDLIATIADRGVRKVVEMGPCIFPSAGRYRHRFHGAERGSPANVVPWVTKGHSSDNS
jgi:hypothetical protein